MSSLSRFRMTILLPAMAASVTPTLADTESNAALDEIVVEAAPQEPLQTQYVAPSTVISDVEIEGINYTTVEDLVRYEPSLVVRRRYIGDPNGVVGIRGSNMFQTARTLVYADGLPLHYLLETRWNGAPRWGLVAADEIQSVEVIYGPYSAEYSGNAMGGVINIRTRRPTEREFHAEAAYILQDYDDFGADDSYTGHREFLSYGDKFDKLSAYVFHNHLDNDGQPMTFIARNTGTADGGETPVSGAIAGQNSVGRDVVWVGDSGAAHSVSDLTKLKLGYDAGQWSATGTLAFEVRDMETRPENYLRDAAGNPIWSGNAVFAGQSFAISGGNFAVSDQERKTVLLGANLEGPIGGGDWLLTADLSWFEIIDDKTRSSDLNPADPAFTSAGSVTEYDDTGWTTLDLKARNEHWLGRDTLDLLVGYHYDHYRLNIDSYDSDNYRAGDKTTRTTSTGGETRTQALFAQLGWRFAPQWDATFGARYEHWQTIDGYYYRYNRNVLNDFDDRSKDALSPKFSLGYAPADAWQIRYSVAKAYRFPIVEELYRNQESILGTSIADETLDPEVGLHHNLMVERAIPRGFARVNLFHEVIEDAIWSQTDYTAVPTVSTFLPVDEVTTSGIEFILQQDGVFDSDVDVRFNLVYTDSEITKNRADPSVEGKVFPRTPRWRSNLLGTWHVTTRLDSSLGIRYASDSYGNLDNSDRTDRVYGAQDKYLFVDLKANYRIDPRVKLSFGIDNLTNEIAYVAHPWPQRTYYLQGSLDF
ncbi:MAG: TonB-dependent receptor [Chromatiales bacterium]|nr:TonB-dependent receptor [Chromatiales bacterium]